ncbi:hypothetical protein OESDEN_10219 [Oesophagostomum dentatum]|uniref:Glutaminyl-tRNA synthetase class Ib non-specific RNA-binding domain-containing protein n=1 Tax=Oesophagostomum dentatum TaxID=61180 RepID=A0A0B1T1B4_OESDE|nr:hypothetical protein OESDEN_10219 [Oesophagostomum dentatum]
MANLSWLGLSEQKVKETEKNAALVKQLNSIITVAEEALKKTGKSKEELTKQQGTLLYQLGTKIKPQCAENIPLVISYIINGGIKSEAQVSS